MSRSLLISVLLGAVSVGIAGCDDDDYYRHAYYPPPPPVVVQAPAKKSRSKAVDAAAGDSAGDKPPEPGPAA